MKNETASSMSATNSAIIGTLIESHREIKEALVESNKQHVETNKSLNTLIQAQIRTEERQSADREWQRRIEKDQEKQDASITKSITLSGDAKDLANEAKSQSLRNGMWINFGVAVLTGVAIYIIKIVIDLIKAGVTP